MTGLVSGFLDEIFGVIGYLVVMAILIAMLITAILQLSVAWVTGMIIAVNMIALAVKFYRSRSRIQQNE